MLMPAMANTLNVKLEWQRVLTLFAPVKMLLIARRSLSDGFMYVLRDCTFG